VGTFNADREIEKYDNNGIHDKSKKKCVRMSEERDDYWLSHVMKPGSANDYGSLILTSDIY